MKERLYLTENMREQINEGLKDTMKNLEPYFFKIPAYPNVLLLERVLLEIFSYSTANEILTTIEIMVLEYQKTHK